MGAAFFCKIAVKKLTFWFSAHPKALLHFQLIGVGLLEGSALHKFAFWRLTPETFLCAIDHIPTIYGMW
jgi:hypothetical protein